MGGVDGAGDVAHQPRLLGERQLVAQLAEAAAVDVLHGDVRPPLRLAHLVDLADVGMGDPRLRPRLAQEALGLPRVVAVQELERHPAAEGGIERLEHRAHAARSRAGGRRGSAASRRGSGAREGAARVEERSPRRPPRQPWTPPRARTARSPRGRASDPPGPPASSASRRSTSPSVSIPVPDERGHPPPVQRRHHPRSRPRPAGARRPHRDLPSGEVPWRSPTSGDCSPREGS